MRTTEVIPDCEPPAVNSRRVASWDLPTLILALALTLGVLDAYLLTLSHNYSPDSMSFAILADQGQLSAPLFFQAEHILYPFVGWAWYRLWVSVGYGLGPLVPMQALNAIAGAVGTGIFFLALRALLGRSKRSLLISIISALLLAFSYGYWFHSTDAEDQIIANALVLGAFLILVVTVGETKAANFSLTNGRLVRFGPGPKTIVLGVVVGLAILAHGTTVLFLPTLALGLWLRARRIRPALGLIVGVVIFVGLALAIVGTLVHGFRSPDEYVSWLLSAPSNGVWGRFSLRSLWVGAQGMANAVVYLQGGPGFKALLGGVFGWQNALAAVLFLGVASLSVLAIVYLAFMNRGGAFVPAQPRGRHGGSATTESAFVPAQTMAATEGRPLRRQPSARPVGSPFGRQIALVCLAWIVVVGLFNFYWAPEDSQFWVGLLPPLIVALAVAQQDLAQTPTLRGRLLNGVFFFGIGAVVVINSTTAIVPRSDAASNEGLSKALCLGRSSDAEDLFITPGWDWASGYVPYFARRQVLSIVDSYLLEAGGDRNTLFRLMEHRIAAAMARGGRVYVVRLFSLDENDGNWLKRTTGLTNDDFNFKREQAWSCGGEVVWEVVE